MLKQIRELLDRNTSVEVELVRTGYQNTRARVLDVDEVGLWLAGSPESKQRTAIAWAHVREVKFL